MKSDIIPFQDTRIPVHENGGEPFLYKLHMNGSGSSIQNENANGSITGNYNKCVYTEMMPDGFKCSTYLQLVGTVDKIPKIYILSNILLEPFII
jgi:hypothetical protein